MATLNIFCAGAAQAVVTQIAAKFQRDSGNFVNASFGAVGAMKARVVAGEPADVIVLTAALIDELIEQGVVVRGSRVDLGKVGTGVAVRAGTPLPDVVVALEGDHETVTVPADETFAQRVYLTAEPGSALASGGQTPLTMWIEDLDSGRRAAVETVFQGTER